MNDRFVDKFLPETGVLNSDISRLTEEVKKK
jgi:hypothetical protein